MLTSVLYVFIVLSLNLKGILELMNKRLFFTVIFTLLFQVKSYANECATSLPNSSTKISTSSTSKCINVKNVNIQKTYFVADPSFQQNAAYNVKVSTVSGTTILNKDLILPNSMTSAKLNTQNNTEIRIDLTPLTSNMDYSFYVVHDENTISGETSIYIGLHSKKKVVKEEPKPPTCDRCEINSVGNVQNIGNVENIDKITSVDNDKNFINENFNIDKISTSSASEAPQCSDANRPPESPPTSRTSGEELNINGVLRESSSWMNKIESTHSYGGQFAAAIARLIVMHKAGGALDVAHASNSDYVGSASMGNFLYGANARAMGFSEFTILRGAAFYQPIGENGWSSAGQGIYNALTNTGDNPGDPEETLAGVRYHDEVFKKNETDNSSVSCNDAESSGSSGGSVGGGSEGGGDDGFGGVGGGFGGGDIGFGGNGGGGGTWWCFVQAGYATQCWIEFP